MRHFCTLFDSNYLLKGVAMLRTLKQHCPDAHVHVLCMDVQTREILEQMGLPHVSCLSLSEVEDEALLADCNSCCIEDNEAATTYASAVLEVCS